MDFSIIRYGERICTGIHRSMTIRHDKTRELWEAFMKRRNSIPGRISPLLFSMQKLPLRNGFPDIDQEFEKWAACETCYDASIPDDMKRIIIPAATWAVFPFSGNYQEFGQLLERIYRGLLNEHGYMHSAQLHFECFDEYHRTGKPGSREYLWIPVHKVMNR
jgi:predicted transcriptional regulator YdeE